MDRDHYDSGTGEIVDAPSTMPPAVAAAIIAVKKQVKQLGHDDKNEHGRYNFVSVDNCGVAAAVSTIDCGPGAAVAQPLRMTAVVRVKLIASLLKYINRPPIRVGLGYLCCMAPSVAKLTYARVWSICDK